VVTKRALGAILNWMLLLFLPLPLAVVAAVSISPSRFISFPPTGFSLIWYEQFFASPQWMTALGISTVIAIAAALVSTTAAVMAALALESARSTSRGLMETLILAPLIFPHAAIGVAIFGFLASTYYLRGTYWGVCLAHILLCVPFAYRPIAVAFHKLDRSLAEAAMNMGAKPFTILWRITLPAITPGIVSALLFTFIVSFDEITVTLFLTAPGITTLPLMIYSRLEQSADPVVAAVSTLLVLLTLLLVIVLQRTVGLELFVNTERDDGSGVR
jgi:putative spermidine/putrescine transport system permease protein